MANVLKHRFVSGKTDGPDASQIQPSNWNDGHAFLGGNAGDVLTRDLTDATYGAKWGPGGPYAVQVAAGGVVTIPAGYQTYVVLSTNGTDATLYGTSAGSARVGAVLYVVQTGRGNLALQALAPSAPGGQLLNFSSATTVTRLAGSTAGSTGGSAAYVWDGNYWTLTDHVQGGSLPIGLTSGNLVGFSGAIDARYVLRGRTVDIWLTMPSLTISNVASLTITGFPWTFNDATNATYPIFMNYTPTAPGWGNNIGQPSGSSLIIYTSTVALWPAMSSVQMNVHLSLPIG